MSEKPAVPKSLLAAWAWYSPTSLKRTPLRFRTVRVLFVKIRIKSRPSEPPSRANAGSFRPSLSSSCVSAEGTYGGLAAIRSKRRILGSREDGDRDSLTRAIVSGNVHISPSKM